MNYRGRLAPTPTGQLHLGHARTFWIAQERSRAAQGRLILRLEDLDQARCKPQFCQDIYEDLRWFGLDWQEGPDLSPPGEFGPYEQIHRLDYYRAVWAALAARRGIYPSPQSRRDVERAIAAPHEGDRERIFPPQLRPKTWNITTTPSEVNWRFRVPDGEVITFIDNQVGLCQYRAGQDFGDFIIWRRDGFPSYELAVVADDHAMAITEVVRGEDLLLSTAKQILLYRALGWAIPDFYHCPLVRDAQGKRLAKRDQALALRTLRAQGVTPEAIRQGWDLPVLG
ncbi:MAG: tRNA glutamyl-Q synthetase [Synechococcales cyanobacterium RM1_1_8]|nr:tRNA glutamyl-Q synthetase [Synechococcales cyanobacterium RM1_1_8]